MRLEEQFIEMIDIDGGPSCLTVEWNEFSGGFRSKFLIAFSLMLGWDK